MRGSWRRNRNCNVLTPLLWPSTLCLSHSPGLLNRRPRGSLYWMMTFFTVSYQQLLWSPNSIGVPEGPFGRVWLSLPHLLYNSIRSLTGTLQGPQDPFGLMWLYLPHLIYIPLQLYCNCNCKSSGAPRAPSAWCSFPYHISSITPTDL